MLDLDALVLIEKITSETTHGGMANARKINAIFNLSNFAFKISEFLHT